MRLRDIDASLLDIHGMQITPCHDTYEVWGATHNETTYEVEWSALYYRGEELTDIDEAEVIDYILENYVH